MLEVEIALDHAGFKLDVRFTCGQGVSVLFGRSGAGKSTVLSCIAGLSRPDRGRIIVEDRVLFDSARSIEVPVHRRKIGYVFQDARLLPHLTVRQNLLYGYRLAEASERRIDLDVVVDLLDIAPLLGRRPAGLSGGERQRVAIGRALLSSPRLLLMDEPLAALDMGRRAQILRYIERLRDELHVPIVYVSHAIEEVARLADSLVLLDHGKVIASGAAGSILSQPKLRQYVGGEEAGALLEAKVSAHDEVYGLTTLTFAGGSLLASEVDALIGESVRVRIRARDVSLALSPPQDVSILNVLAGQVCSIQPEPGGAMDVSIAIGATVIYARITRLSTERLQLVAGKTVYALVKAVSLDRSSTGLA